MTVCRDSRENRNLEQTDKIVASRRETARKICNRFDKNTHRHNKFGRWLHKYEKLCRLTKRFWDTTECIVEHSQNMANNLVYLFYWFLFFILLAYIPCYNWSNHEKYTKYQEWNFSKHNS